MYIYIYIQSYVIVLLLYTKTSHLMYLKWFQLIIKFIKYNTANRFLVM